MDFLSEPGHRITLLAAHDNMMTAFLVALGVYKNQWPLYASMVLQLDRICLLVVECAVKRTRF